MSTIRYRQRRVILQGRPDPLGAKERAIQGGAIAVGARPRSTAIPTVGSISFCFERVTSPAGFPDPT